MKIKPDENKKPDAETIKDGEYSINFKALKDQTDEISMMNTYTKSRCAKSKRW